MKILVINAGSSSIKYQLFSMETQKVLASGMIEKIGEANSVFTHNKMYSEKSSVRIEEKIPDHVYGFNKIVTSLLDTKYGVVKEKSDIDAIGHRVVHGGEDYTKPTQIDRKVLEAIQKNSTLAPLHNPANLRGIEIATTVFPKAKQVAVFDTAFHQTLPRYAYMYAIPYELYEKERIRRYGFHGTSHSFIAKKTAEWIKKPIAMLSLITIHLGNGASMAAIKKGTCIDTSMGMTPLDGLIMGTRSGDCDAALPFYLHKNRNMDFSEIETLLNKKSGLKGICGTNDMRKVLEKYNSEDKKGKLALEMYTYRLKKYIGAYYAALGSLDAIVFTGGIGENSPEIRELSCHNLENLGVSIDQNKNVNIQPGINDISSPLSKVTILVIPTNEELEIALQTREVVDRITINTK